MCLIARFLYSFIAAELGFHTLVGSDSKSALAALQLLAAGIQQ